jgi:MFS family permease
MAQAEIVEAAPEAVFPAGLHNAYLFSTFNALSYQIVLYSPMVLYAKTLGASATILGIIAGMMPMLVIFQIPAANYVPRVGFKRFVYAGWGTRVMFIFAMALVPLTGIFLTPANRLALLLSLLFFFNLSRGISSCAWLPWITALVPARLRGTYLSRDQAVQNAGSFVTTLIGAACLAGQTRAWQFALLFGFSAAMGAVSLSFLKRIPDAALPEEIRTSKTPVPWLEMLRYGPFKKLLVTVISYAVAYGGIQAFTVAFLKSEAHMSETRVLLVTSAAFVGGLSSLWFLGSRLDRLGSKPILTFCFAVWVALLGGWFCLASRAFPVGIGVVLALQFCMGLLAALISMANTRLAMVVIPVMGRNHFFAIYSVASNVTLGVAPVAWGLLIDAIGTRSPVWHGLEWNRFSVFFAAAAVAFLITLVSTRRLQEEEAVSMEELLREVLVQTPQRVWLRFWPRS